MLAGALAVTVITHATYAGASAAAVTAVTPSTVAGRVLAGLVQLLFVVGAVLAIAVTLRHRRFRLLASLAGVAVVAGAALIGIVLLAGGERPLALAAGAGEWSWLTGASLVGPALLAAAVAGTVAAAPWLSRPWRRTARAALWLAAVARLVTGTASPMEVVVAFAAGVAVGAGALVLFGVPDRRIGPDGIAAALASAGLPVAHVGPAAVEPNLLAVLNSVSALLDTGTLRALDARVELAGQTPGWWPAAGCAHRADPGGGECVE